MKNEEKNPKTVRQSIRFYPSPFRLVAWIGTPSPLPLALAP